MRKELKKSGQLELVKLLLRLVSKGFGRVVEAGPALINEEVARVDLVAEDIGEAVVDAKAVLEAAAEVDESAAVVDEGPESEELEPNKSPPVFCRRQRFNSPGGAGCGRRSNNNSSYPFGSAYPRLSRYMSSSIVPASDMPHKVASTTKTRNSHVEVRNGVV